MVWTVQGQDHVTWKLASLPWLGVSEVEAAGSSPGIAVWSVSFSGLASSLFLPGPFLLSLLLLVYVPPTHTSPLNSHPFWSEPVPKQTQMPAYHPNTAVNPPHPASGGLRVGQLSWGWEGLRKVPRKCWLRSKRGNAQCQDGEVSGVVWVAPGT